ncbi:MAG TPA: AAA family ATPase [Chitinophagales bacterium]|nr:AAA family ATPase [Chitinophagales bacterium]
MEKFKKTVDGIDFYSSKKFNEIDKVWITGIFKGCADGKFKSPKVLEDHPNIIGGVMNIGTKSTISNNINDEKIFIYFRKNWYTINDILELEKWKITFDSFYCNLYSNLEGVVYLSSIKVSIEDKFGEFKEHHINSYQIEDKYGNAPYLELIKYIDNLEKFDCWYDYKTQKDKINKINKLNIDKSTKDFILKNDSKTPTIEALNTMIGLSTVKKDVSELVNLIKIREVRKKENLPITPTSLHLVFTGNPGTGKTTVARIIGQIYKEIGVLEKGHFVEADRAKLVGEFVGHTAVKTTKLFNEALGGVLFIDEAYTLSKGSENDFGKEAIDCLLKLMEDNREKIVVIIAGYTNEIEQFLNSNPGLRSRFPKYIHFEDYSSEELLYICLVYFSSYEFTLDESANKQLKLVLNEICQNENFGNGRGCRNLVEKIITCQANRIAQIENLNKIDLTTIKKDDIDKAYKID